MRIIIIGAGDTGRRLAARLCEEKHDIVVIDRYMEPLDEINAEHDIQTLHGNGTSPQLLESAGVSRAGLVAAVTGDDEVNILAAIFARQAGAHHTAVRVSSNELTTAKHLDRLSGLGVDLVVNEHDECAREVLSVLEMGGATELVHLCEGRIQAVGINIPDGSPLLEERLQDFNHPDALTAVRLIAVMRKDELLMPTGNTRFEPNDTIYCVGRPDDVRRFLDVIRPQRAPINKVVIAGGGDLGLRLACYLQRTDKQVVLIEEDSEQAHACSAELKKGMVFAGNALDRTVLDEIGITPQTAVVSATGDDENNIIACLLTRKLGAAFGVAIISNPEYVLIINDATLLDRAVSPYLTTMNAILRYIRGGIIRSTSLLQNVPGELLEVQVSAGSKWVGKALKNAHLPHHAIIAAVVRDDTAGIATGDTVLHENDHLIVFAPQGAVSKIESVFCK